MLAVLGGMVDVVTGVRARFRGPVLLVVLAALTACGGPGGESRAGEPVLVAAASNLRFAFESLAQEFERGSGVEVVFTFGSSGNLAEQITQGAPYDVYAPANTGFLDRVIDSGRVLEGTGSRYATGRLALRVRDGLTLPDSLAEVVDDPFARIAIANPTHAPYGQAAREALRAVGVWDRVQERLVFAENVADALRMVDTGNVDAAFVALSLVVEDDVDHLIVDESLHGALEHPAIVITTGANPDGGRRFIEFLKGESARVVLERYGYSVPDGWD